MIAAFAIGVLAYVAIGQTLIVLRVRAALRAATAAHAETLQKLHIAEANAVLAQSNIATLQHALHRANANANGFAQSAALYRSAFKKLAEQTADILDDGSDEQSRLRTLVAQIETGDQLMKAAGRK